jgi:hypothetical protein
MTTTNGWASAAAGAMFLLQALPAGAAVFQEDFSSDPATRGWQQFGEASAFHWDPAGQNLEVTWDSTRPNSFFFHPLGTTLSKDDDFSLAFDLRLSDIASGAAAGRTGPFEIAVGLFSTATATNGAFRRGTGTDSPNLVEFDYFPAGYYDIPELGGYFPVAPTVWAALTDSNTPCLFSTGGYTTPLELTANDWFRIILNYTSSNHTLATTLLHEGQSHGSVPDAVLGTSFSDFRVDAVSISSYSDAGDAYDSVLAHGVVDNLVVTVSDGPRLAGTWVEGLWQAEFTSRTNWIYRLERSPDLSNWAPVSVEKPGTGAMLVLSETNRLTADAVFYRTRARRP